MKLWGGRFTKETDQLVHNFNESLSFDQKFYHQDIEGSIAHVKMLEKQGILTAQDRDCLLYTSRSWAAIMITRSRYSFIWKRAMSWSGSI